MSGLSVDAWRRNIYILVSKMWDYFSRSGLRFLRGVRTEKKNLIAIVSMEKKDCIYMYVIVMKGIILNIPTYTCTRWVCVCVFFVIITRRTIIIIIITRYGLYFYLSTSRHSSPYYYLLSSPRPRLSIHLYLWIEEYFQFHFILIAIILERQIHMSVRSMDM